MNRKYIFPAIVLSLILLCSCATNQAATTQTPDPSPSVEPFDLDSYKSSVKICSDEINEATIILYNMAKFENNYWNSHNQIAGSTESSDIVEHGYKWIAENSEETEESIGATNDSIRSKYKEIILIEVEGKEGEEIEEAFRGLYDSYTGMYDLVTSPGGSINDFVDGINDNVNHSKDCADTLALFLDGEG